MPSLFWLADVEQRGEAATAPSSLSFLQNRTLLYTARLPLTADCQTKWRAEHVAAGELNDTRNGWIGAQGQQKLDCLDILGHDSDAEGRLATGIDCIDVTAWPSLSSIELPSINAHTVAQTDFMQESKDGQVFVSEYAAHCHDESRVTKLSCSRCDVGPCSDHLNQRRSQCSIRTDRACLACEWPRSCRRGRPPAVRNWYIRIYLCSSSNKDEKKPRTG